MSYTFTRTGAQIEEIHNTVDNIGGITNYQADSIAGMVSGTTIDGSIITHVNGQIWSAIDGNSESAYKINSSIGVPVVGGLFALKLESTAPLVVRDNNDSYIGSSYAEVVEGRSIKSRTETETNSNRPVAWSYNMEISPPVQPSQTTDYHGMDIYGEVGLASNSLNLGNVRNYLFESKASYTGSGTLGQNVAGFFESNNYGSGLVGSCTALRLWSRNQGVGEVSTLYGINMTAPVNNGSVTDSYGIYLEDVRVGSSKNFALYSAGGDFEFTGTGTINGSLIFPYSATNEYKISQRVATNEGSLTLLSNIGATQFELTYPTTNVGIDSYRFNQNGSTLLSITNDAKLKKDANGAVGTLDLGSIQGRVEFDSEYPDTPSLDVYQFKKNNNILASITNDGKIKAASINFSGLPTSASGLVAGDVWNDAGVLKIV